MSTANLYWDTLNKMLREDQMVYNTSPPAIDDMPVLKLTFTETECLTKGIRFALDNVNVLAKLEYDFNDGQPIKCTTKHLHMAKTCIDCYQNTVVREVNKTIVLNALSKAPISDFLLNCHVKVMQRCTEFLIYTDEKRKTLVKTLFGDQFTEEIVPLSSMSALQAPQHHQEQHFECTQIIFDSSDFESAIDTLLINLSDRTLAPWRIHSVYVQESLKNELYASLNVDRLNSANNITTEPPADQLNKNNLELIKRYGGQIVSSANGTISFLFDVPPKYVHDSKKERRSCNPVTVNFFRTAKEVIQLANGGAGGGAGCNERCQLATVWTENISLLYEMASNLNSKIIWSNSIGVFDMRVPCLNTNFAADPNEIKSSFSSINLNENYAVHRFVAKEKLKYLIISFGQTFAN